MFVILIDYTIYYEQFTFSPTICVPASKFDAINCDVFGNNKNIYIYFDNRRTG